MTDLLTTREVARFVADGYLRYDALVPDELCRRALEELRSGDFDQVYRDYGRPLDRMWPDLAMGEVLRLPRVQAIVRSLLGPEPRFDHQAHHRVGPGHAPGANLHQDNVYDARVASFDIQLSFFFHPVGTEDGGTLFVPGSHQRRVHEHALHRIHHLRGEVQTVCPAGTLVVWHHNLWHAACPNRGQDLRSMFKLRLQPTAAQVRSWDTADLHHEDVMRILRRMHPWQAGETRQELIERIRWWRRLTGDPDFDIDGWAARIEQEHPMPEPAAVTC